MYVFHYVTSVIPCKMIMLVIMIIDFDIRLMMYLIHVISSQPLNYL